MKMKNSLPIIFLILLSIIFIFYRFADLPKNLAFDEVEFTKLALSLDGKPYTPYSPLATGHSTLYFYILLSSFKIFGVNTFALRLPAAVFGILSIFMFYKVMSLSFQKKGKFFVYLLTFIFLTSRWFINFSRFAFEATFLLFLELTSIYFFLKAFIKTVPFSDSSFKELFLIFSGLFAGLAFNSYTPGRIFFILPLGFIILNRFVKFSAGSAKNLINNILFFTIPFLIIILPLIISLSSIKDTRIDQLFFWRNHEMTLQQKVEGTLQNISSLILMFFYKGDMNGRHNYPGKPALNPIMFGLFIIGLIYSIKNYKKNFYILYFIFYIFLSLAPSVLIYPWENPSMLRTFTTLPSVVYFIGQGLIVISKLFLVIPNGARNLKKHKIFVFCFLFLVILFSSFYEVRTYFKYQAKVFESSFEIKHPLDKAIKMKNPYE